MAKGTVKGQLEGAKVSGEVGVDGLWARLRGTARPRGRSKRVVLVLVDSVTGLIYPPVVVEGEEDEAPWKRLFGRAKLAGLSRLRGVTSDGASGLVGFLAKTLYFVNHQRCVFHIWRNLGGELAKAVAEGDEGPRLAGEVGQRGAGRRSRAELTSLVHQVLDAKSEVDAERALAVLRAHRLGGKLAELVAEHLDAALVHLNRYNRGLVRVGPEWLWRDFRLRVSRGRNHGSDERLERAALVWQVYANFTPAQGRKEKKRKYKRPGKSSLEMAGVPPGSLSYLDPLRHPPEQPVEERRRADYDDEDVEGSQAGRLSRQDDRPVRLAKLALAGEHREHEHQRGEEQAEGRADGDEEILGVRAHPDRPMARASRDVTVHALTDLVGVLGVAARTVCHCLSPDEAERSAQARRPGT